AVESMPVIPGFQAAPAAIAPALAGPVIPFPVKTQPAPGRFQPLTPAALRLIGSELSSNPASLVPISTLEVRALVEKPADKPAAIPKPGLITMDYFCQRLRSLPRMAWSWKTSSTELALQQFTMRGAQEKLEDLLIKKPEPKPEVRPEPAKVVTLPQTKVRSTT